MSRDIRDMYEADVAVSLFKKGGLDGWEVTIIKNRFGKHGQIRFLAGTIPPDVAELRQIVGEELIPELLYDDTRFHVQSRRRFVFHLDNVLGVDPEDIGPIIANSSGKSFHRPTIDELIKSTVRGARQAADDAVQLDFEELWEGMRKNPCQEIPRAEFPFETTTIPKIHDPSRFPHTCVRCGAPAYNGIMSSECSRRCA